MHKKKMAARREPRAALGVYINIRIKPSSKSVFENLETETDRSLKVVEMTKFYAQKVTGQ